VHIPCWAYARSGCMKAEDAELERSEKMIASIGEFCDVERDGGEAARR
jgi:hypothetical protein